MTRLLRFWKDQSGVALVELAFGIPLMFLVFAVTVEGGRMFYAYQAVIEGVRDAGRYAGRAVPRDLCISGGAVTDFVDTTALTTLVSRSAGANPVFPMMIAVTGVDATHRCVGVAGDYRVSPAPVVEVTATLQIRFPFQAFARAFFADNAMGTITTTVSDESRVFGS